MFAPYGCDGAQQLIRLKRQRTLSFQDDCITTDPVEHEQRNSVGVETPHRVAALALSHRGLLSPRLLVVYDRHEPILALAAPKTITHSFRPSAFARRIPLPLRLPLLPL